MIMLLFFFVIGLSVGTLGTLIGAGGGFLLVPLLLFLMPERSPSEITAISLFAVTCNAASGSIAYARRGQIHWRSALLFTAVSLPGAWFGSHLVRWIDPRIFQIIFCALLTLMGLYLLFKKARKTEKHPHLHNLSTNQYVTGALISIGVSLLASFLGIGGGIVHVPLLSEALGYPVHLAAGTSHFILAASSFVATLQHGLSGDLPLHEPFLLTLALGLVLGAQIGAHLSRRIQGYLILRILGLALLTVAVRLTWKVVSF